MGWREPMARPARGRRKLDFNEVSQLTMKLAGLGDSPQHVLPASDMHSACNRKRALGEHQGAVLPNLFEVASDGLRYTAAGDVDYSH